MTLRLACIALNCGAYLQRVGFSVRLVNNGHTQHVLELRESNATLYVNSASDSKRDSKLLINDKFCIVVHG